MFSVGDLVVVLPPFGDGATAFEIAEVQHVNAAGEIVGASDVSVQYVLVDGTAYAPQWLEAAP